MAKNKSTILVFLSLAVSERVHSRSWRDIQTYHDVTPIDTVNRIFRFEQQPSTDYGTPAPISSSPPPPIPGPDRPPRPPGGAPISFPTARLPTEGPASTSSPASSPTEPPTEPFPENDTPLIPPVGYFNYDFRDENPYGPGVPALIQDGNQLSVRYRNNGWANVQMPQDFYWSEFGNNGWGPWNGALSRRNLEVNQCGNTGGQSPIDIRLSGVACVEHHQIRTRAGDFRVNGAGVQKRIESNKLRLVYQRRPCADVFNTVCSEPDPPTADFPNGWGGFADMLHVDFKLPAEHRIYGEVFDAEMQIFHLHVGRERLPAISVLIRVDPLAFNPYLQMAIDAFQFEYDKHKGQCADQVRRDRKMVSDFQSEIMAGSVLFNSTTLFDHHEHWAEFSTDLDNPEFLKEGEEHRRRMQSGIWHPYHEDLIPTYWFYGYDGSLTEPPCSEIVSWFVMDTPMLIAPSQLEQMKTILFTHVDENCQGTSAHFQESVARPIQESSGREIWRCTRDDFPPDSERNN